VIALPILLALYFLPTLVAAMRHHHNAGSIFVLNLFLGWTGLVWIISLAMACSHVRRPYLPVSGAAVVYARVRTVERLDSSWDEAFDRFIDWFNQSSLKVRWAILSATLVALLVVVVAATFQR